MRAFEDGDRKSTRLNSSHGYISYAVFCLKKKNHIEKVTGTYLEKTNYISQNRILSYCFYHFYILLIVCKLRIDFCYIYVLLFSKDSVFNKTIKELDSFLKNYG